MSSIDIEYEFTIQLVKGDSISVGIADAKCQHINDDFAGQRDTFNYAYAFTGTIYSHQTGVGGTGQKYGDGMDMHDIITMMYNPYKSTLSFTKNGKNQGTLKDIYSNGQLDYRFCVAIPGGHIVQLVDS